MFLNSTSPYIPPDFSGQVLPRRGTWRMKNLDDLCKRATVSPFSNTLFRYLSPQGESTRQLAGDRGRRKG